MPSIGGLGAPWNLSIIDTPQGWLLHWEHPTQGLETLRLYTVRWWKEPEHFLIGTAETFDNFYQLRHLKEDVTFKIQVVAVGADARQVASPELLLEVPSQRKVRALIIGSSVGIIFLLCALCAFLYVKRSCLRHLFSRGNEGASGDEDTAESGDCDSDQERDSNKIRAAS